MIALPTQAECLSFMTPNIQAYLAQLIDNQQSQLHSLAV